MRIPLLSTDEHREIHQLSPRVHDCTAPASEIKDQIPEERETYGLSTKVVLQRSPKLLLCPTTAPSKIGGSESEFIWCGVVEACFL